MPREAIKERGLLVKPMAVGQRVSGGCTWQQASVSGPFGLKVGIFLKVKAFRSSSNRPFQFRERESIF